MDTKIPKKDIKRQNSQEAEGVDILSLQSAKLVTRCDKCNECSYTHINPGLTKAKCMQGGSERWNKQSTKERIL